MKRFFHPFLLSIAVIGMAEALSGCSRESSNPDVQAAESAVGIDPNKERHISEEKTRDVTVVKDTKVIDNQTGKTISEKSESTPVKITEQKSEKTSIDVNVGDTKAQPAPK
ncbi:hypothetical protein ACYOEI_13830 [Singulisphaera rosea]